VWMCSPVSDMESAMILDSVSKRFGSVVAVQGLDLEVAVTRTRFVNKFVLRAALGLPLATSLTISITGAISNICYRSASNSAEKLYVIGVN